MKRYFFVAAALYAAIGCRTTNDDSQVQNVNPDGRNDPAPGGNDLESTGGLRHKGFEVRFTNPVCKDYLYSANQAVISVDGQTLTQKPKNTFCSRLDSAASASRPEAPQYKLIEWIRDADTKEIFFAYLSLSNKVVVEEVCKAIKDRSVKVTFVLDSTTDLTRANELLACEPGNGDPAYKPKLLKRGNIDGIGYAHNKIFFINPNQGNIKLAVSSGNMSSGIVLHHENWLFIQPERDTYFTEAHRCLMKGQLDHYQSKAIYQTFIKDCRKQITYQPETDIQVFFVPGEGNQATQVIESSIKESQSIKLAAHRFGYSRLINALKRELDSNGPASLQMIFDDDTYWAGQGTPTGDNAAFEYTNAMSLKSRGAQVKWMETNHSEHLLHHNKFLIFNMPQGSGKKSAVFTGAGNFTGTAFSSNFENFYFIEMPSIVAAYNKQYDMMWSTLASDTGSLPKKDTLPPIQ
jgi:hypothetical protein